LIEDALTMLKKFQLKYGFVEDEVSNNFPYWNFSKFRIELELKIMEALRFEIQYNLMEIDWNFEELMKFESEAPDHTWKTHQLMTWKFKITSLLTCF
jgi:hypothetical protein